jgi:Cu(I)/Ag(I) efflux system periplasmic protein CusF
MKRLIFASLFAAAFTVPAFADDAHQKKNAAQGSTQTGSMSEGEVRKVDKEAKKITLRHGPMQNLDMPAMTMVFQVKDPAMLEQVREGDKVKFRAEKIGGAFTITKIEPAN